MEPFRAAMLETCYHVTRNFWIKPDAEQSKVDMKRNVNCVEVFLVGFGKKKASGSKKNAETSLSDSEVPEKWQCKWGWDNNEQKNRRNYTVAGVVEKYASFDGKVRDMMMTLHDTKNCN